MAGTEEGQHHPLALNQHHLPSEIIRQTSVKCLPTTQEIMGFKVKHHYFLLTLWSSDLITKFYVSRYDIMPEVKPKAGLVMIKQTHTGIKSVSYLISPWHAKCCLYTNLLYFSPVVYISAWVIDLFACEHLVILIFWLVVDDFVVWYSACWGLDVKVDTCACVFALCITMNVYWDKSAKLHTLALRNTHVGCRVCKRSASWSQSMWE